MTTAAVGGNSQSEQPVTKHLVVEVTRQQPSRIAP